MRPIILFIIVIASTCDLFSQDHYRLKRINDLQFTLPPKSGLVSEGWFCRKDKLTFVPRSRCRYQYMAIKGLKTDNYYTAAESVHAAEYFYARRKQTKFLKKNYCGIIGPGENTADGSAVLYVSANAVCAAVEVDMDQLFTGDIRSNYLNMTIGLLQILQTKEASLGWPKGISQRIIAELFQVMPYPEESSLLRFVADTNKKRSFVLLDSSIRLQVDAVERLKTPNTVQWHYRLLGTSIISFTRNAYGDLIQSPLYQFEEAGPVSVPNNIWSGKSVLLASTADVQFSSALNRSPYVFVQQRFFKKNNNVGSSEGLCAGLEDDLTDRCNSVLYHFSDLRSFYDAREGWINGTRANYLSSFGTRNLITPLIDVIVNGRREQVPLNTSLRQFRASQNIPIQLQYFRLCRGKYTRVDLRRSDDILLLPGDTLTY